MNTRNICEHDVIIFNNKLVLGYKMNLTLENIAKLCNGRLSPASNKNLLIKNITTNSKETGENKLFIALKGSKFDGNDFIKNFLINDLSGAITNMDLNIANLVIVNDTQLALELFATNYRKLFNVKCVIITGSNGKTTVKNLIKNICIEEYTEECVIATEGNLNNHIGLPLTLLKLNHKHKILILEAGMNHSGELNKLTKISAPDVAVVSNVFLTHIGQFTDIDAIAEAKFEIYNGLNTNGVALINQHLSYAEQWFSRLRHSNPVYYGDTNSICCIKSIEQHGATVTTKLGDIKFKLKILGEHNYYNALTSIAVCLNLNCKLSSIKNGLEKYGGYTRRLEIKSGYKNCIIIDDTYNASLSSVIAAIKTMKNFPKPHWLILGDCLEVGKYEQEIHELIGDAANDNNIDFLITYGKSTSYTNQKFKLSKKHCIDISEIVDFCFDQLPFNATVLVKGSNSMNLDLVVNKLIK